jgi:hypothetical protein
VLHFNHGHTSRVANERDRAGQRQTGGLVCKRTDFDHFGRRVVVTGKKAIGRDHKEGCVQCIPGDVNNEGTDVLWHVPASETLELGDNCAGYARILRHNRRKASHLSYRLAVLAIHVVQAGPRNAHA